MDNLYMNNQSFSVEDIRRVREADHQRWQGMTPAELTKDIHKGAEEGHRILEVLKRSTKQIRQG